MDQQELADLKEQLRLMQARVDQLEAEQADEPVNRRGMLRSLGAAAVGAAAGGLAFARPAAATDGNSIVIGNSTQTANSPTLLIMDDTYSASPLVGLFHVTDDAAATDANVAFTSCITAAATGAGMVTAFAGQGSSYGAKLDAPVPLKLLDSGATATITTSGYTGQFKVIDGNLWFCVDHTGLGNSAVWRKLAGVGTAGSYHPLTPARVYDSRPGAGGAGPLATGNNRTVSVANSINASGAVVTSNFVPAGATAVVANITVTNTVGTGYMGVNPGGTTTMGASAINWTAGVAIANGLTFTLNSSRQLTVVAGGTGTSANFLIDVFGYYL